MLRLIGESHDSWSFTCHWSFPCEHQFNRPLDDDTAEPIPNKHNGNTVSGWVRSSLLNVAEQALGHPINILRPSERFFVRVWLLIGKGQDA